MTDTTKTPWHLWAVGGISALWNAFGVFDFTATALRFEAYLANYPQAMLDHIYAAPVWMWAAWVVGVFGALIGSILLLMRNKLAVPAFALSLIGAVVSMGAGVVYPPPPEVPSNIAMTVVIIAIAACLLIYAWWTSRKGIIR